MPRVCVLPIVARGASNPSLSKVPDLQQLAILGELHSLRFEIGKTQSHHAHDSRYQKSNPQQATEENATDNYLVGMVVLSIRVLYQIALQCFIL